MMNLLVLLIMLVVGAVLAPGDVGVALAHVVGAFGLLFSTLFVGTVISALFSAGN